MDDACQACQPALDAIEALSADMSCDLETALERQEILLLVVEANVQAFKDDIRRPHR